MSAPSLLSGAKQTLPEQGAVLPDDPGCVKMPGVVGFSRGGETHCGSRARRLLLQNRAGLLGERAQLEQLFTNLDHLAYTAADRRRPFVGAGDPVGRDSRFSPARW
jgi:hypothetical protein